MCVHCNHESLMIHEYQKVFKLSIRKMEREVIEIIQISLKLIFLLKSL